MIDIKKFRGILEARRHELETRLGTLERDLDAPVTSDLEDQAIELEDDEVQESLGVAGLRELDLVRAALARVEDGSYGICLDCGDEISQARLEAVPHAPLCRNCAGAGKR